MWETTVSGKGMRMSSKVSDKNRKKTKRKQCGSGVADTMKIGWNVGSVKTRKK